MKVGENTEEIREFIRAHSSLFWYTPEDKKEEISHEFLVETILNYGDEKSIKRMFELLGNEYAADIFYKQTIRQRINYFPQVVNYFTLYFKKHVQGNTD